MAGRVRAPTPGAVYYTGAGAGREAEREVAGQGYGTRLPDILDDWLAILGEPSATRAERRPAFRTIDVPALNEVFDLQHPSCSPFMCAIVPHGSTA